MLPEQPDLFGQVPVTVPECLAWVEAVAPRWAGSSPEKLARYITTWDVPRKVAEAKRRGILDAILAGEM